TNSDDTGTTFTGNGQESTAPIGGTPMSGRGAVPCREVGALAHSAAMASASWSIVGTVSGSPSRMTGGWPFPPAAEEANSLPTTCTAIPLVLNRVTGLQPWE